MERPPPPSLFQSLGTLPNVLQDKVSLQQVLRYASYVASIRDEIIMVLPTNVDPANTPIELAPVFYHFLADACSLEYDEAKVLWKALGRHIWPYCDAILKCPDLSIFKQHGHLRGFSMFFFATLKFFGAKLCFPSAGKSLYPPTNVCTNANCTRFMGGLTLGKVEQRNAVLFTLGQGAIPIHSVHKYCEGKVPCPQSGSKGLIERMLSLNSMQNQLPPQLLGLRGQADILPRHF